MEIDLVKTLAAVKEGGGLVLLALALFRFGPLLIQALDRNTRILYRIEGRLGIQGDSDRMTKENKEA